MRLHHFLYLLLCFCLITSCEDVIDIKLKKGRPVLVVDGWLTNKRETQYVNLYYTRGISQSKDYQPVGNARLVLSDDAGHREVLAETDPGKYAIKTIKGATGRTYKLSVETEDGTYEAVSLMPRIGLIPDTLAYHYREKSLVYPNPGFYPLLSAQELEGKGDRVQIKLYKNGIYQNKANDLNLFSDDHADSYYIFNMELDVDSPYVKGDRIRAEIWSLNEDAWLFWKDVEGQLHNAQIFATPLTNSRSNLKKLTPESGDVTGYFGTSIVRSKETVVK